MKKLFGNLSIILENANQENQKKIQKMKEFRRKRERFKSFLNKQNIEPVDICSKQMLGIIKKENRNIFLFEHFDFENSSTGSFCNATILYTLPFWLFICILFSILGFMIFGEVGGMLGVLLGTMGSFIFIFTEMNHIQEKVSIFFWRINIRLKSRENVMSWLFRSNEDYPISKNNTNKVRVSFQNLPKEFNELIARFQKIGIKPCIGIDSGSISINNRRPYKWDSPLEFSCYTFPLFIYCYNPEDSKEDSNRCVAILFYDHNTAYNLENTARLIEQGGLDMCFS